MKFILGFFVYCASAYVSYSPVIKASRLYFPVGISLSVLAAALWLLIAKSEAKPEKLLILGFYWDSMLTLAYLIIPFIAFRAEPTRMQVLGIATIILGIILTKL